MIGRNKPISLGIVGDCKCFLKQMLEELQSWLEEKDYESVEQMKGSMSHENSPDPSAFERGNYMKALQAYAGEPI